MMGCMTSTPERFEGFPTKAFDFYDALADNNTRLWWGEHKGDYTRWVREPLLALMEELRDEFGDPHVYRPYRDARFSKGSAPLKDHQGAVVYLEDAIAYYVQVSAQGLMIAGGWYASQGLQLARYRESVVGPAGAELERILSKIPKTFTIDGQQLKTKPRGYERDHPRIDLLRNKAITGARIYPVEPWVSTRKALSVVRADWRALRPLIEWLADHVGPATEPSTES